MAIINNQYGLVFKDEKDERVFRHNNPTHPYSKSVDLRFIKQTVGKSLTPQQNQNIDRIIDVWGNGILGGNTGAVVPVNNPPINQTPTGVDIPQYNPMPSTGGGGSVVPAPVLDQTKPVIVDTPPNSQPTVPIGSGGGNPTNRLELNSLVAVGVGFIFIRGAFKLLGKLF